MVCILCAHEIVAVDCLDNAIFSLRYIQNKMPLPEPEVLLCLKLIKRGSLVILQINDGSNTVSVALEPCHSLSILLLP